MMSKRPQMARSLSVAALVRIGMMLVLAVTVAIAAPPDDKKPSTYSPIKEVVAQINQYIQKMNDNFEAEADYADEHRDRLVKDASTVAALAMVLGLHDQDDPMKASASAILESSRKLAEATAEFKTATEAYAELKAAAMKKSDAKISWEPAAGLGPLMKQVPIVNNALRRNVTGKRFKQTADASAGLAATLATLAQVSRFDDVYCSTPEDKAKWDQICVEMRDVTAEVMADIRKGDQESATKGLDRLVKTCDACHHDFRDK